MERVGFVTGVEALTREGYEHNTKLVEEGLEVIFSNPKMGNYLEGIVNGFIPNETDRDKTWRTSY